jgi:hypothetical protein
LDRRVERLEREFGEFKTDVALIKAEQIHMRQLVDSRFGEVTTTMTRVESGLEAVRSLVQLSTTDVAASPLGRSLAGDISEVKAQAAAAQLIAERVEKKLIYVAGALAVLVAAAAIVGPLIADRLFGLMP